MQFRNFTLFVGKRLLHTKSATNKGTKSIRKENDIHTAEYFFENGTQLHLFILHFVIRLLFYII
jgi:hypothetical protein